MELSQDETFASTVEAYETDIFVDFSFWIGRLRGIAGFVLHLEELAFQCELITPFNFSATGLSVGGTGPTADQKLKRSPDIGNCVGSTSLPRRQDDENYERCCFPHLPPPKVTPAAI